MLRWNSPGKHVFFSSIVRFSNSDFVQRPLGARFIANCDLLKLTKPNGFQTKSVRLSTIQTRTDLLRQLNFQLLSVLQFGIPSHSTPDIHLLLVPLNVI